MTEYQNRDEYLRALEERAVLPQGFSAGSAELEFFPEERKSSSPLPMKLSALMLEDPTPCFGGVFTSSAFPGAPVLLGRERLESPQMRGVLINNKVANVGTADGRVRAEALLAAWAALEGTAAAEYFGASTGIIGWGLPLAAMKAALPNLQASLQSDTILPAAQGIMTTDAYPKVRSRAVGEGRITAIAKGAGMIEPNMGTMLVYILTDIDIPREEIRAALVEAADQSFNLISVDGDQSTSDMALIFSSRRAPSPGRRLFQEALNALCRELAEDIVRNGEGTRHVLEVSVIGAPSADLARETAKAVVNSPLVKTAVFGNDPNVGRFLGALGDFLGNRKVRGEETAPLDRLELSLMGEPLFRNQGFLLDPEKEERLSAALSSVSFDNSMGFPPHEKKVILEVNLGYGDEAARVLGSDLSYDYVRENADYRT